MRENYDNEAFTADYFAQYDNTISNGEARIPICFCIDTSGSMNNIMNPNSDFEIIPGSEHISDGRNVVRVTLRKGVEGITPMTELRRVLIRMLNRMKDNKIIMNSAVICIVSFDQFADCVVEFSEVRRISERVITQIHSHEDYTNAAKGINMSLERLKYFKRVNSTAGNESYKPVLIFMSDGSPTDGKESELAGKEVRQLSDDGKLNVIPIAIGNNVDETWMRRLSRESRVYHMIQESEFDEVFDKITRRISQTTMVISVDEGINNDTYEGSEIYDNISSSQYGARVSEKEMMDFLNAFMDS